ncbi:MAG: hypothetical protein MJZ75_02845 [Paludibacteraceae bacterium]|nr:hypothetical protein [Paludibacteraceae bacterium]
MKKVLFLILGLGMGLSMMAQKPCEKPQCPNAKMHQCQHVSPEQMATKKADMLRDSLQLTDVQYEKAYNMYLNRFNEMKAKHEAMMAEHKDGAHHAMPADCHHGADKKCNNGCRKDCHKDCKKDCKKECAKDCKHDKK